jgi:hypothetical protein
MDAVDNNETCHLVHIKPDADEDSHHKAAETSSLSERICHSRSPADDAGLSWLGRWQVCVHG